MLQNKMKYVGKYHTHTSYTLPAGALQFAHVDSLASLEGKSKFPSMKQNQHFFGFVFDLMMQQFYFVFVAFMEYTL